MTFTRLFKGLRKVDPDAVRRATDEAHNNLLNQSAINRRAQAEVDAILEEQRAQRERRLASATQRDPQRPVQPEFEGPEGIGEEVRLNFAEKMKARGIDKETIWKRTGVIYGPDGLPRYEIPDIGVNIRSSRVAELIRQDRPVKSAPLTEIMEHDRLYKAHPELAETFVIFSDRLPENILGQIAFHSGIRQDVILINRSAAAVASHTDLKKLLLHEAQHIIQKREGMTGGSNPVREVKQLLEERVSPEYRRFLPEDSTDPIGDLMIATQERIDEIKATTPPGGLEEARGLIAFRKSLREIEQEGMNRYWNNIGEVEARDVEARMVRPFDDPGEVLSIPPAVLRKADLLEEASGITPDPAMARPRNPRNWPWLYDDGIHYDHKGLPFKIKNKKVVEMTDAEMAEALENAPETALSRTRLEQQRQLEEFRQSQEFRNLQQRNLSRVQRAREQALRETEEFQELQQQALERARGAREGEPGTPAQPTEETPRTGRRRPQQEGDFERRRREALERRRQRLEAESAQVEEVTTNIIEEAHSNIPDVADMEALDAEALANNLVRFNEEVGAAVNSRLMTQEAGQELLNEYVSRLTRAGREDVMGMLQ